MAVAALKVFSAVAVTTFAPELVEFPTASAAQAAVLPTTFAVPAIVLHPAATPTVKPPPIAALLKLSPRVAPFSADTFSKYFNRISSSSAVSSGKISEASLCASATNRSCSA